MIEQAKGKLAERPTRNAIQHSGLPAVRGALARAFAGSLTPDATYRQEKHLPLPRRPGLTIRACPAPPAPQRPMRQAPRGPGISKV